MRVGKPFNREAVCSNIAEAFEQLQKIEIQALGGTLSPKEPCRYTRAMLTTTSLRVERPTCVVVRVCTADARSIQQWGTYPRDIEKVRWLSGTRRL